MKVLIKKIVDLVCKYPNDMELGARVRHFIQDLENFDEMRTKSPSDWWDYQDEVIQEWPGLDNINKSWKI